MQDMKKTTDTEDSKKKERHIVTWSQEEDDILREQIGIHGTDNWSIIASKFKDKTTRQCRRRWYTYLNSDFKKGGWSPEEDMLLCEAQKIFGNRWTEIAKVVSGRTDNAVKNRFTTLCKKRAKYEALAKENNINLNSKRIISRNPSSVDGTAESAAPAKRMRRAHIQTIAEDCNLQDRLHIQCGITYSQQQRTPFSILEQNFRTANSPPQQYESNQKEATDDADGSKVQRTFLKKDDPKVTALVQQAELLSSLALKVNADNVEQSLENTWKVLQEFLSHKKDADVLQDCVTDTDLQFEDFKVMVEDIRSSNEESQTSWRQPDLCEESPASSEYSTASTISTHPVYDKAEEPQAKEVALHKDIESEIQTNHSDEQCVVDNCCKGILSSSVTHGGAFQSCDEHITTAGVVSVPSNTECISPVHVTPLFRSLAAGIPTPKFSESERHFLLKTFGMDLLPTSPPTNSAYQPPCKRALLQSL
ncbi:transcription factor MYB124 isoform X1 [Rhodamnia argentea]|uniref:Transcription factor MYB124 isoform X1 n=1 Tax=Rhodamnia argentea TaxID=178133 RepID=A0A8B8MQG0_9MYRT|nr:transcription factor MYB124 isoform X1 [Rhodamnia argentea]XP_030512272.1 transcription factor MYB124 isoform X1 [Rhodamnia argentea]XP_048135823.1 transcription factor MYB124 isoform X1 [Rhodamnia argentea]